jgi:hypothetical protein
VEAAKVIGVKQVPVIRVAHLNEAELRAYALADNRLAEKSGWNREMLAIELGELQIALPEIDLDIGITGFERGESTMIMVITWRKRNPIPPMFPTSKMNQLSPKGRPVHLGRRSGRRRSRRRLLFRTDGDRNGPTWRF